MEHFIGVIAGLVAVLSGICGNYIDKKYSKKNTIFIVIGCIGIIMNSIGLLNS